MITVTEAARTIIRKSPFIEEALARGIINISALARQLRPDIERVLMKDVTESAIVMALNRLGSSFRENLREQSNIFSSPPDLMVRSNLFEITFMNSRDLIRKRKEFLEQAGFSQSYFITFTQGIFETTIIASIELKEKVVSVFEGEQIISLIEDLSSITTQLPEGAANTPGAYNYILRALAWEQINIVEVVSTFNEFTIILHDVDIDRAFFIIKRLF